MVVARENRTDVEGVVTAHAPHPGVDRWELVTLRVERTGPVAGFPDLVTQRVADQGGVLELAVDREALGDDRLGGQRPDGLLGRRLRATATLAGPGVVRAVGGIRSTPAA